MCAHQQRQPLDNQPLKYPEVPATIRVDRPKSEGNAKNCLHRGFEGQPIKSSKASTGRAYDCMYSKKVKTPPSPSNQVPELISGPSEAVKACLVLITCACAHIRTVKVRNLPSRLHRRRGSSLVKASRVLVCLHHPLLAVFAFTFAFTFAATGFAGSGVLPISWLARAQGKTTLASSLINVARVWDHDGWLVI